MRTSTGLSSSRGLVSIAVLNLTCARQTRGEPVATSPLAFRGLHIEGGIVGDVFDDAPFHLAEHRSRDTIQRGERLQFAGSIKCLPRGDDGAVITTAIPARQSHAGPPFACGRQKKPALRSRPALM